MFSLVVTVQYVIKTLKTSLLFWSLSSLVADGGVFFKEWHQRSIVKPVRMTNQPLMAM